MLKKLSIVITICFFIACSGSIDTNIKINTPEKIFSLLLQESIDHSYGSMPGVSMAINSPFLKESWNGAAGFADKELNKKLEPNQVFRIASVTKTFVAAAILRLYEMDSLSIEDPIGDYIDKAFINILKSDGYDPEKILIKHCLNHTSGIYDYAMGSDDFVNAIVKDSKKRWTRKEQLTCAMQWGDKLGKPGAQTAYSDTGYILLGSIIEKFYQGNLAKGLRALLKFEKLGLTHTWLETLESHPLDKSDMVHRYHGKFETTDWDASIDLYGGGGLVSNTADLADFFNALFNSQIYDNPSTINLMLSKPAYIKEGKINNDKDIVFYNYGMWTIKAFGKDVHMHKGLWGITLIHIPAYNTSIAVNATKGETDRMIKKVLLVLEQLNQSR